ncbi:MAG: ABC transporter ATP-binding protein/permease [Defluviitaleaceae bacterium]|nr:ABC transporter ATP-binding protein/permease [Defluviitaleaceae bacterium]
MEHNIPIKKQLTNIRRAFRILRGFPKPMFLSAVLAVVVNTPLPFVQIWFSAQLINELVGARDVERLTWLVAWLIGLNFLLHVLQSLTQRWRNYCTSQNHAIVYNMLSMKMMEVDLADLENPELQLEYSTIRDHINSGAMTGQGILALYEDFSAILAGIIRVALSVAFAFTLFTLPVPQDSAFVWLDAPLAVAGVFLIIGLNTFVTPYLRTKAGKTWIKAAEVNQAETRFLDFYMWTMTLFSERAKDIRIYDQKRMINKTADRNLLDVNKWRPFFLENGKIMVSSSVIWAFANGVVYLYVAMKAFAGAFGVGNIVQYVGAINQFSDGLRELLSQIGRVYNNAPFLDRFLRFLDTPKKMDGGEISLKNTKVSENISENEKISQKYELEFHNVSFKYPGSEKFAIQNLNFKVPTGRRLAVVGMNGSGKTTMIKLLCRLYDPTEGKITLNGVDIKSYDYQEYLEIFSVVFQDFAIMSFKLGENIANSDNYDREKAEDVLKKAGFGDRLEKMPHGLDTYLYKWFEEDGVEISGGEAQKIILARALYKDSPIVILDEPTAALDPIAEHELYTRFDELIGGKTSVYISHRLSSCRFCDDIAVFHEGRLIQQGRHEELLAAESGKYFELWTAQAQYYA